MSKPKLHLTIITQDKQLADVEVEALTIPTTEGEITVLPNHIPLLSRLQPGELRYKLGNEEIIFVVSKGFVDVAPNNTIRVLVDTAVDARQISLERAQAAMKAAEETMATSVNREELIMAEASLRRALLEIKVAHKTKRASF